MKAGITENSGVLYSESNLSLTPTLKPQKGAGMVGWREIWENEQLDFGYPRDVNEKRLAAEGPLKILRLWWVESFERYHERGKLRQKESHRQGTAWLGLSYIW